MTQEYGTMQVTTLAYDESDPPELMLFEDYVGEWDRWRMRTGAVMLKANGREMLGPELTERIELVWPILLDSLIAASKWTPHSFALPDATRVWYSQTPCTIQDRAAVHITIVGCGFDKHETVDALVYCRVLAKEFRRFVQHGYKLGIKSDESLEWSIRTIDEVEARLDSEGI